MTTVTTKNNYIDNKKLYEAMAVWIGDCQRAKAAGNPRPIIPNYIAECIVAVNNKLILKREFCRYQFAEEMIADGILNCLHRDTKVMTLEHGPIEISKIVGQTVTVKARDGVWREAEVKSFGRQKLFEYGFGWRGKRLNNIQQKVIATENHRWFVDARLNSKRLFEHKKETITDLRRGDILENVPVLEEMDQKAVLHGLVFGDGSGHKAVVYGEPATVTQGSRYASIRVCKQDKVRDEIIDILTKAGFTPTYPPSAKGDPIFFLGRFPLVKDVPFTHDPSYIAGFIYGWWLADGLKKHTTPGRIEISTTNEDAVNWIRDYSAYAGYHLISYRKIERKSTDGSYKNGKPLFVITLGTPDTYKPHVRYKTEWGEDEVFCVIEPVTHGFVLGNGLLTGNCLEYLHNFDPVRFKSAFNYLTTIAYFAFVRRIQREKRYLYTKLKISQNMLIYHEAVSRQDNDNGSGSSITELTIYANEFISKYEELSNKRATKK